MGTKSINAPKVSRYLLPPEELKIIGLDTDDGPEHPLYDDRIKLPIDKMMVNNIMAEGVLQAISCIKDGDDIFVVEGRQRVRNAREANKLLKASGKEPIRVEVKLEKGKDHQLFGIMISANEIRRDDTPLAKARKVQRYMAMGRSMEEAAIRFGVSTRSIQNWLQLLDLDTSVQSAVDGGKVAASAVAGMASLPKAEQKEKLKDILDTAKETGKRPTQRKVERKAGTVSAKSKAPGKKEIKRLLSLEPDLLFNNGIDDHAIKILRWAIGELPTASIGGLTKLLEEANKVKEPKAKEEKKEKKEKKVKEPKVKKEKKVKEKKVKEKKVKGKKAPPRPESGTTSKKKRGLRNAA